MRKYFYLAALAFGLAACGSKHEEPKLVTWPNWASSRTFTDGGRTFAPMDFQAMDLRYRFSPGKGVAEGEARITFKPTHEGFAFFLAEPAIQSAELDGEAIMLESRRDPDNLNTLRVIPRELKKDRTHRLKLRFTLSSRRVDLHEGGVGFLTSMSDMGDGNYFEAYAPSNFENDAFRLRLSLEINGSSLHAHELFTNGKVTSQSNSKWKVEFPSYFTSSSFYVHLTDTPVSIQRGSYSGMNGAIPLTVYSRDPALAAEAFSRLPTLFSELESTYGPFAHESFTAYISGRGGMEYAGATITSVSALGHELTHSWFARGVMPSDGRSGWIDEAIASWRDNGYFRAARQGTRAPTNLGRASAFERFTPGNSYRDGRLLLSELDQLFADQGGLRPLLKEFFSEWKRKCTTTDNFRAFLERNGGVTLHDLFQTYVYGNDAGFVGDSYLEPAQSAGSADMSGHPSALTYQEIRWLR